MRDLANTQARIASLGDAARGETCNEKVPQSCQLWAAPEMARMSTHPPPPPLVLAAGYTNKVMFLTDG